jgi:glucose-6-phosphate isomerase
MAGITDTAEWRRLEDLAAARPSMRALFDADPVRATAYSLEAAGLFLDYSRNRITDEIRNALIALAETAGLEDARRRLFAGERINVTEGRAVLHPALRDLSGEGFSIDGHDISSAIVRECAKMEAFVSRVHAGELRGRTGKPLDTVVNIGIGGSDLGPQLAVEALRPYWVAGRRTIFVSNVDGQHLADALETLNPDSTLFVISSKTFTTQETMTNAASARNWFLSRGGAAADIAKHFVAISTNQDAVRAFGISPENLFAFWDWVGGRYSLWSAIGLSIALQAGFATFERMLRGAHEMDAHFRSAPIERNMPIMLALVGIWNRNFEKISAHAVLPYDQHLARLPAYLQQLDMESNGKSRRIDGAPVDCKTGPVIFGEPGTNGQHAFYQLIHQGTDPVSSDFIAAALSHAPLGDHHEKLLANFLAQPEALMWGRTEAEVRVLLAKRGDKQTDIDSLAPHMAFPGERPTSSILMEKLTPEALGALLALYEHKIFCQGVIWGINSFDQWGVELGKSLAASILPKIARVGEVKPASAGHDSSTLALLNRINAIRRKG